ncbi:MAG TPA: dephospho-CoA kinase [Actinomycetota bacterium]|nr:dephospho-CoA kinase [Actinomycetota bacterium]
MLLVGLTGGIGSGKSTVARMLASRGAVVIDADGLARELVAPGTPGLRAVVSRFGDAVVAPDGSLDRAALAEIVFTDDDARADLEAIVHPAVLQAIARSVAEHADTDDVVVVDAPLLIETGQHAAFPVVIVVTASRETRIARLSARGMSERDVRSRIAAQMPLEDTVPHAHVVLDNDGDEAALDDQVERLWADLRERALSSPP